MSTTTANGVPASLQTYLSADAMSKVVRIGKFATEHPKCTFDVTTNAAMCGLLGTSAGVFAAAAIGAALPVVAPVAMKACPIAGAIIGTYYGTKHSLAVIEESGIYEKWKTQAIASHAYSHFEDLCKDPRLNKYHCPLTGELVRIPMRDKKGVIWECSAITKYISEKGGKDGFAPNPVHNQEYIKNSDLTLDLEYHRKVQGILNDLKRERSNQLPQGAADGIAAYMSGVRENRARIVQSVIAPSIMACMNKEMTPEELGKRVIEMSRSMQL